MGPRKMANVDVEKLSKDDKDELVCTYAALLLHDSKLEITGEKLNKVIKASGNTSNHTGQASSLKLSKDKTLTLFSRTSDLPVQLLLVALLQVVELLLRHQRRRKVSRISQRKMSTWEVSSATTITES